MYYMAQDMTTILKEAFAQLPRGGAAHVARELNLRPDVVSKWATGKNGPHRDIDLRRLEQLLHLEPGTLGYVAGTSPLALEELRGRVVKLEQEVEFLMKRATKGAAPGAPRPHRRAGDTP